MEVCSVCKEKKSIYYQRHSGLRFCRECFIKYIKKKVRKTLGKKIIRQNVKIGMGISGGKDSLVMAYLLREYYAPIPNSEVIGLIVDEGIEGFRKKGIEIAIEFCEKYDIPYYIATFEEYIGCTLDSIVERAKEKNITANPCTFCGVIRRRILNNMALERRCNYLAIGHNLDDVAQAVMMNYIEGDIKKLAILGRNIEHPKFVKRIKPLKYIPEDEVKLFADLLGIKYHSEPCPYSSLSYRSEISDILDLLEERHPGRKYSIVAGFERLVKYLPVEKERGVCKYCGNPSASDVCKVCEILKKLNII
ncbi:TIGR00269 family protein [Methanofervidicoccus sp. A16]|uniref:TIGR00269 family protein n=1 Tax=Methanofervidicoccus sp. A16 TaxID=2607662 RepID=UPI001189601F|nr:TIGR00269 family protein [Methanofervidicoccus sp. A16]AXI24761.1 TIGR00269 family protein [Methanofervidicoccus sp. A16]